MLDKKPLKNKGKKAKTNKLTFFPSNTYMRACAYACVRIDIIWLFLLVLLDFNVKPL